MGVLITVIIACCTTFAMGYAVAVVRANAAKAKEEVSPQTLPMLHIGDIVTFPVDSHGSRTTGVFKGWGLSEHEGVTTARGNVAVDTAITPGAQWSVRPKDIELVQAQEESKQETTGNTPYGRTA